MTRYQIIPTPMGNNLHLAVYDVALGGGVAGSQVGFVVFEPSEPLLVQDVLAYRLQQGTCCRNCTLRISGPAFQGFLPSRCYMGGINLGKNSRNRLVPRCGGLLFQECQDRIELLTEALSSSCVAFCLFLDERPELAKRATGMDEARQLVLSTRTPPNNRRLSSNILQGDNTMHAQFFVGWGTLSLINAGLAQAKGRSGLLWWLLSVLIGPIATSLIVVLPKTKLG